MQAQEVQVDAAREPPSFLSLPAELRVIIYEYALPQRARVILPFPPILLVTKQIRSEALKPFFERTQFIYNTHRPRPPSFRPLIRWLRSLTSEDLLKMRHLEFRFGMANRRLEAEDLWPSFEDVLQIAVEHPNWLDGKGRLRVVELANPCGLESRSSSFERDTEARFEEARTGGRGGPQRRRYLYA